MNSLIDSDGYRRDPQNQRPAGGTHRWYGARADGKRKAIPLLRAFILQRFVIPDAV